MSDTGKIKTVYSFIGTTNILLDLNSQFGKAVFQQVLPYACQNLRKENSEFDQLYKKVEIEQTPNVFGTGMVHSSADFTNVFVDWLKTKGINIDNNNRKKISVFAGNAQNPSDGRSFEWCVLIYFLLS